MSKLTSAEANKVSVVVSEECAKDLKPEYLAQFKVVRRNLNGRIYLYLFDKNS